MKTDMGVRRAEDRSSEEILVNLRKLTGGLALLSLVFAVVNHLQHGVPAIVACNLMLVVILGVLWGLVAARRIPDRWANGLMMASLLLVQANVLHTLWRLGLQLQNSFVAFLLIGAGALFKSSRWFAATAVVILGSWFPVALDVVARPGVTGLDRPFEFFASLFAASGMALIIHTARRRAQHRLQRSDYQYRELFRASRDLVTITTPEGRLLDINPAGLEILGLESVEQARQINVETLYVDPERRQELRRRLLAEGFVRAFHSRFRTPAGRLLDIEGSTSLLTDADGKPQAFLGILREVSERKRIESELEQHRHHLQELLEQRTAELERETKERLHLEQKMLQAQKLESLGLLAGGIAHDFNNLLTAILGNVWLAMEDLPPGSPARRSLETATQIGQRAQELTLQLFTFTGKRQSNMSSCDLGALVEEVANMLRTALARWVRLELEVQPGLAPVQADVTQLRQVLMNLLLNASEALEGEEGTIRLSTGNAPALEGPLDSGDADLVFADHLGPPPYVQVEVADTGCGMNAATLSRLFDPFFTTKPQGRGLGMAAVLGILRSHRAAILVHSRPGHGTTFRLLFSAASQN